VKFLIWSIEHKKWWRPNGMGYTPTFSEAGRFSLENAVEICRPLRWPEHSHADLDLIFPDYDAKGKAVEA
jgi:hypothetical protein